ncbi:MAG: SDR family oxidoreductase [Hyphomicrobium sp.]|nr:SDR family oxidoreductase [Hyphomicrobium sp.]
MLWHGRKSRDTPARRNARAAVRHLKPAVVITGGSRGIGLAFAHVFLEHGATVLLVARNLSDLQTAAQSVNIQEGERCFTLACDITAPDASGRIDRELQQRGCYLECLVNNAAMGLSGPFTRATTGQIDELVAVNIASLTRLTRHALPNMIARGQGGIINVASLGGYVPGPNQAAYYASKAYVLSLSEAIASELSGLGVRITTVAPGPVATGFHADMGADGARYRVLLPELTSEHVARSGYRAFTLGQRVVVPGLLYRLVFLSLRALPHPLSVPLTAWLLKNSARAARNAPA